MKHLMTLSEQSRDDQYIMQLPYRLHEVSTLTSQN